MRFENNIKLDFGERGRDDDRRLHLYSVLAVLDLLCGLVVTVPTTDPEIPGSIPGAALPDFLRSSRSGTGSTEPHEYNWGATCMEK
jgi:hypothetical protein